MPDKANDLDLAVDLMGGVIPISKAASALAALLKRSRERRQPIIVTQKGYPSGVLLDVELYTALRSVAMKTAESGAVDLPKGAAAAVASLPDVEDLPPPQELAEAEVNGEEGQEGGSSRASRRRSRKTAE